MKTFYTERDIEDMQARGVTEIEVDDDVVLTDLARDKAIALGVHLKSVARRSSPPNNSPRPTVAGPSSPLPAAGTSSAVKSEPDLAAQVKAAVIARLGTTAHNDLLDQVIPQVLARLQRS